MELWDLYTSDREKTDRTMIRGEKTPDGFYRIVVHVCIFNDRGQMLIQQRQPFKKGWSNLWDITVGGSAVAGDTSRTAAQRELKEELGIEHFFDDLRPALTINFPGGFDDIYLIEKNVDLTEVRLQYEEVQTVRWSEESEILAMIDNGDFIPYHKSLISMLFFLRNHSGTHTHADTTKPTAEFSEIHRKIAESALSTESCGRVG